MSDNPYESPQSQANHGPEPVAERVASLRDVRMALLILLVPAIYNFICFAYPPETNQYPLRIFFRIMNLTGFVLVATSVWFFGLAWLEFATGILHAAFARVSKRDDWKLSLYHTLRRAPQFALLGAGLWTIWVAAIYQLEMGFHTVSVPIGVAAHLTAAGLYVPLIVRWYKLERDNAV